MKNVELRKKAFEIAAGLIEKMDLVQFWGDEIYEEALEEGTGLQVKRLDEFRARVVRLIREEAR